MRSEIAHGVIGIAPSKELNVVEVSSISSILSMNTEISEKNGSSSGKL